MLATANASSALVRQHSSASSSSTKSLDGLATVGQYYGITIVLLSPRKFHHSHFEALANGSFRRYPPASPQLIYHSPLGRNEKPVLNDYYFTSFRYVIATRKAPYN
jgi:hypothetical protein